MSDLDYYRERLAQESHAARIACSPEAEMIHRSLATAYARKASRELQKEGGENASHAPTRARPV